MNAHAETKLSAGGPADRKREAEQQHTYNGLSGAANTALVVVFALLSLACLYPLLLVVAVSFTDEQSIVAHGYNIVPRQFSLYAYRYLFDDASQIFRAYGVSIAVTLVGTLGSLLLTSLLAFPLSRRDMPYRNTLAFAVFFTMLFSGGLVPWYLVYNAAGLNDTLWALVIPHLVAPFNVIIMRTFFANTIPVPLIESAKIDGAGELRIFARIILPLSMPVMATIGLFQTLAYWNDWFTSSVFVSDNKLVSLQYLMYKTIYNIQYLNSGLVDASVAGNASTAIPTETVRMAMAIVGIGPIVFVYPLLQKYFVKGLTVGAVKG
ncbi:carbohydrate ABC transporter permease [Paenibacillus sacheonensis]|uniref:ABC transporter permease subunit n=1 Tax=Paenibacillus sacheonensis TaxID=742054 RepID=A0A7X4YT44_9BACL|nr:carbohydrate ABC transporter permease [Paenibacillus sacheonensis]MBM7563657.1 putative aldouronate transport system permease protein [Paenibacillus sacheonensis]NBC71049.1 ABC transporter permease subunit [Paenibacillus sacheonensis]